jgi:thiazole synthase ThiGH ThiG subunit
VILDGGVGSVEDYRQALALGADGCLVNSMLFACAATPDEVLRRFVDDASERVREP